MYTLTLVINKTKDKVLMCRHKKQHMYNYIGGKVEPYESPWDASYRELEEETCITRDMIDLHYLRFESVDLLTSSWTMFITCGILYMDYEALFDFENPLEWVPFDDLDIILKKSYGDGNCYTFLMEALRTLGIKE